MTTSLSGVHSWALYEAFMEKVQGREHSQTKTGNDSVLSLGKNLTAAVRYEVFFNVLILPHISPSPIIPKPDHTDTQLCDLTKARTS